MDKMTVYDKAYNKAKLALKLQIEIILESYRKDLANVMDDDELCRIVDEVISYIASTGYEYFVGPFETTIEGPYDELTDIVKECQHIAIKAGAPAVAAYVKISYKPEGEVLSIEKKIGKYHG